MRPPKLIVTYIIMAICGVALFGLAWLLAVPNILMLPGLFFYLLICLLVLVEIYIDERG